MGEIRKRVSSHYSEVELYGAIFAGTSIQRAGEDGCELEKTGCANRPNCQAFCRPLPADEGPGSMFGCKDSTCTDVELLQRAAETQAATIFNIDRTIDESVPQAQQHAAFVGQLVRSNDQS